MGHVGAGKSSLISALLGEMEKMTGRVSVKVHISHIFKILILFNKIFFMHTYVPSNLISFTELDMHLPSC